jgi:hypothetical protein
MARALSRELEPSTDKRRKLAVMMAIGHSLQAYSSHRPTSQMSVSASDNGMISTIDRGHAAHTKILPNLVPLEVTGNGELFGGEILSKWISLLSNIIHDEGYVHLALKAPRCVYGSPTHVECVSLAFPLSMVPLP